MLNTTIIDYVNKLVKQLNIKDFLGVIVYGSYVCKRANELSDLDVMIIKDNYDTQDCGNIVIDGIRVEYFIQDLKRLYRYSFNSFNFDPNNFHLKFIKNAPFKV